MKPSSKKQEERLRAVIDRLQRGPASEKSWRLYVDTWVLPHLRVAVGDVRENSMDDLGQADARLLPISKHEGPFRVSGNAVDDLCDECGERHEGACEEEDHGCCPKCDKLRGAEEAECLRCGLVFDDRCALAAVADLAVPAFKRARDRRSITEDEVAECRAAGLVVRLRRGEDGTPEAVFRTAVLPLRSL